MDGNARDSEDPGTLASRYRLDERIGSGGMGEVWQAHDRVLDRPVAVKILDLGSNPDDTAGERFRREALTTASINHPNIVTVYDSGVEGDRAYIVMELLPGPTLAERLGEGPLPVAEVEDVARQVAVGLGAAHARGLVHRDIKPANIMQAEDGSWRVVDFGISRLADDLSQSDQTALAGLTATQTVIGTADYLAPEQALGQPLTAQTDLYSLGCLLWALLVGKAPLVGTTPVATMLRHANEAVPDVRTERSETPAALAGLIEALTQRDPAQRPESAVQAVGLLNGGEIVSPIDMATATMPAEAPPTEVISQHSATQVLPTPPRRATTAPPPPPPPARQQRREPEWIPEEERGTRWGPLLVAALLVLVLGIFGWSWWSNREATPDPGTGGEPTVSEPVSEPTPEPTPEPMPEATPETTPSTEAPAPADPSADVGGQAVAMAIDALDSAVKVADQAKAIEKPVVQALQEHLRAASAAVRSDSAGDADQAVSDLRSAYDQGVSDGDIGTATKFVLDPLVSALESAVKSWKG